MFQNPIGRKKPKLVQSIVNKGTDVCNRNHNEIPQKSDGYSVAGPTPTAVGEDKAIAPLSQERMPLEEHYETYLCFRVLDYFAVLCRCTPSYRVQTNVTNYGESDH